MTSQQFLLAAPSFVEAAAWRLAAEVSRRVPGGVVVEGVGRARPLNVLSGARRGAQGASELGGVVVLAIDRGAPYEAHAVGRSATSTFAFDAWGAPAARTQLLPVVSKVMETLGLGVDTGHALPTTPHTLTARVLALLLSRGVLSDVPAHVRDVRKDSAPPWLARRDDLWFDPGQESDRPVWGIAADREVISAVYEGWLLTPAGESVNLYARYRAGASLPSLLDLAMTAGLAEARPPGVVDLPSLPFERERWLPTIYSYEMYWRTETSGPLIEALRLLVEDARRGKLSRSIGVDTLRAMFFYMERAAHFNAWEPQDDRAATLIAERLHAATTGRVRCVASHYVYDGTLDTATEWA